MWWLFTAAFALPPDPGTPAWEFKAVLERMDEVGRNLEDCTFTLYKREYVDGAMTPVEAIEVKFRPESDLFLVYPARSLRVLFRGEGWNGGLIRVDPGRFIPSVNLHPTGALAMRGNRHDINDLPNTRLVKKILRDAIKVRDSDVWLPDVQDLGVEDIRGEPGRCFVSNTPKAEDSSFYSYKTKLCVNPAVGLPNYIGVWDLEDGEVRLVEEYQYIGLKVDVGLTDADFDPATYGL